VSAIFRGTIWNETIPGDLRGRLAGVEMISYLSGHLLGNVRAGWIASMSSNEISIVSGGRGLRYRNPALHSAFTEVLALPQNAFPTLAKISSRREP
jgi:hypothetical protein